MEDLLYADTLVLRDGCIRRAFTEESEFSEYYMQQDVLNL